MNHRLITSAVLLIAAVVGCGKKAEETKKTDKVEAKLAIDAAPPPEEPGFEESRNMIFCGEGKHVKENVTIAAGDPYAMLIKGPCVVTLKHCTLIGKEDADQPTVQVMENGVLRLEDCTVKTTNPKLPAIWVSTGGKVTVVRSRLESIMENAVDVWENSSLDHYDVSWTGPPNVRDTGKVTKLDAMPPPL